VNFLDADGLTGKDHAEVDLFAAEADASAKSQTGRLSGFFLQGELHALIAAILLGIGRPGTFNVDSDLEQPDREFA
jgi:hypothetical protein